MAFRRKFLKATRWAGADDHVGAVENDVSAGEAFALAAPIAIYSDGVIEATEPAERRLPETPDQRAK